MSTNRYGRRFFPALVSLVGVVETRKKKSLVNFEVRNLSVDFAGQN